MNVAVGRLHLTITMAQPIASQPRAETPKPEDTRVAREHAYNRRVRNQNLERERWAGRYPFRGGLGV